VALPSGRGAILSDTVGFISDLPTPLIKAFQVSLLLTAPFLPPWSPLLQAMQLEVEAFPGFRLLLSSGIAAWKEGRWHAAIWDLE
jgi:hypothetical protein